MNRFHVGIVDDEKDLLFSLKVILEAEGWQVSVFSDSEKALISFDQNLPDVVILDIRIPGKDGIWLCRELRKISESVPIIFLSAKMDEIDRIAGLESGADDYLCKPFSTLELIVRIKVQKRRLLLINKNQFENIHPLDLDGFSLNKQIMSLTCKTEKVSLTLSEFRILDLLMNRPGVICSREDILKSVYTKDIYVSDRVIDNHIKRIRNKINYLADHPGTDYIETVYGVGYCWRKL